MKYQTVINNIPIQISNNTLLNIQADSVTYSTHGFHKYPAKFIPQIPAWGIKKYLNNKTDHLILDPFCGSGTTLVESVLSGNQSIGVDIDPLSVLISKVKTTPVNATLLYEINKWLTVEIEKKTNGCFVPDCETLSHWFTNDSINKLSIIRESIDNIFLQFGKSEDVKDIYDFFIICFSSIIRRASNADNESQKTYVSHTKIKVPEEVNSLFTKQVDYFIERILEFSLIHPIKRSEVLHASSKKSLNKLLNNRKIDLVITSPPYIKSIDYIYNQMVELFWIGDLFEMQTQQLQNAKKQNYIGNKQIAKSQYVDYHPCKLKIGIAELDKKLNGIFITDTKNGHKHAYITYKYFIDMEQHLKEIYTCLKTGAAYIMVVGDSSISDMHFDTSDYLVKIAERNGFKLVNKWGYKIKNRFMRFNRKGRGGLIETDWVLEFLK